MAHQAYLVDTLKMIQRVEAERLSIDILNQPKYQDPKRLNQHDFKELSQFGEDGIITEIFRRVGTTNRYFVEFGSSSGFECNTTLLLRQGWSGLWMDGSDTAARVAREHFAPEIGAKKLGFIETFITAENVEDLFRRGNVPEDVDFLSIDIDRNDYHGLGEDHARSATGRLRRIQPALSPAAQVGGPLRRQGLVGRHDPDGG